MCHNYNYYISLTPIFDEPKNDSIWCKQNNGPWYKHIEITPGYPVMFLDDIEIHWIHEHSIDLLLEKYNRRIERYRQKNIEPLFLLSMSDLCNDHSEEEYLNLITNFTNIKNSIYLTKYSSDLKINNNIFLIKDWISTSNQRNSSHIYEFHSISNREKYFKDIIANKLLNRNLKYSIVMPIKINSLNSFSIFINISLPFYGKYLETEYIDNFYIVCPENDISIINKYTNKYPHIPFKFVSEDLLHSNINNIEGWFKQQLIKLNVYSIIKTEYYLIVDSDLYLNQPFRYKDLFQENKIKCSYEPWQELNNKYYSTNSNWWRNSCNILNFNVENLYGKTDLMGVTPQIMITKKVEELIEYIKNTYEEEWQKIISDIKFTEYTLYWIFLLINNNTELYTKDGYPLWKHDLERNILDYETEEAQKTIATKSITDTNSYFSVIQGYLPANINILKYELFKDNKIEYDAIFLISSCLTPTQFKFFNVEERFLQTLETVKSAYKYIPNSLCILIEGSILSDEHKNEFIKYFDYILDFSNDETVVPYVKNINNIGHGEQRLLEKGIEFLQNNILTYCTTKYIFKLGARYNLNDNFKLTNYNEYKYNFFEEFDDNCDSLQVYTTGLYSIPVTHLEEFKNKLINIHNYLSMGNSMIEKYFYDNIRKEDVNVIKTLGLEGRLNYNGYFFSK